MPTAVCAERAQLARRFFTKKYMWRALVFYAFRETFVL